MKPIPDYLGYYTIDVTGTVISVARAVEYKGKKSGVRYTKSKTISTFPCNTNGKPKVQLYKNGKKKTFYVHKLLEMVYGS